MDGVAAVEVVDPRHAGIVVVAAVDVRPDHRRRDVANVDREDALLRRRTGNAGVRRAGQDDPVVLVNLEGFGDRLGDRDPGVGKRVALGERLVDEERSPQLLRGDGAERQPVVALEDLHRAGRRRIDGAHRQRRGGVDVRAQHPVRQLVGALRGLRAGQRCDARGADEAVQRVGQVVQARERLLHGGDPRAGDLEGDRAALTELAMSSRGRRGRNPHRVGRARLERRDRAEDLVVAHVAPGAGGARREGRARRAGRRPAVEANRHAAGAVAHPPKRKVGELGSRARRRSRQGPGGGGGPDARRRRVTHGGGSTGGRRVGVVGLQRPRRARDEHRGRCGEHRGADGGTNRCLAARSMPLRTHQSLAFTPWPPR